MHSHSTISNDKKYRLSAAELNTLIRKLAEKNNPDIKPDCLDEYLLVSHRESKRKFYLCPMSRDSASNFSGDVLPYFWDNIANFCQSIPDRDCTLLMPLRMCRFFAKLPPVITPQFLQRQHAVLLEVNFSAQTITVHDSQGNIPWFFYPDKVAEMLRKYNARLKTNFSYSSYGNYHAYGTQTTSSFDCGYFVYYFVRHMLASGSSNGYATISYSVAEQYANKNQFLSATLGDAAKFIIQDYSLLENYEYDASEQTITQSLPAIVTFDDWCGEICEPPEELQQAKKLLSAATQSTGLASFGMFENSKRIQNDTINHGLNVTP